MKTIKNTLRSLSVMAAPKHVGIILDGNRRYAKRLLLKSWEGHDLGFKKFKELFTWMRELDIRELTLYCFSLQNFKRPKDEFGYLMNIFKRAAEEALIDEDIHKYKIKLNPIGRWHLFPEDVVEKLMALKEKTSGYDQYTVNLCFAYGGREEIVDAVKAMIAVGVREEDVSQELLTKHLYLSSEPDLIIRTGGEHRTSNFLIWQSWYSEWFFLEKTWPEFTKDDLVRCLEEFKLRERRFGK